MANTTAFHELLPSRVKIAEMLARLNLQHISTECRLVNLLQQKHVAIIIYTEAQEGSFRLTTIHKRQSDTQQLS